MTYQTIINIINILGYISTVIVVISIIVGVALWLSGIVPALARLGMGLARRKIAIFARGDALISLENLLNGCRLFKRGNILRIANDGDLGTANIATLFLVFWPDWKDKIDEVLKIKKDGTALIVYAP